MKKYTEEEINIVEIHSPEIQEVMGLVPRWITRWGITLIFIILFIFLIGSYFFKYPDIIQAEIVLTTENPPLKVIARSSGKIQEQIGRASCRERV